MSSRVLGNSLVSAAAKREFALNPFSPINKPCLHRTLHIGNKMVFLSSLLDASSSTLSSHCVQSYFFNPFASTYLSKDLQNSSIFFRDDFCPPTCAHPVLYPTAPCPSPPPFSNSCVRCKKKNQLPPLQRKIQLPLIKPIFWGIHCIQNGMWMHFARCAFGQGW